MVLPRPPFLTEADIAGLHDLVGAGLQTVQNFQDPDASIQIERRSGKSWDTVVEFKPISWRLDNTQGRESVGGGETTVTGVLKVWEQDATDPDTGEAVISPGDQFTWMDHRCVVDLVPPVRLGYVAIRFSLKEGN